MLNLFPVNPLVEPLKTGSIVVVDGDSESQVILKGKTSRSSYEFALVNDLDVDMTDPDQLELSQVYLSHQVRADKIAVALNNFDKLKVLLNELCKTIDKQESPADSEAYRQSVILLNSLEGN